MHQVIIPPSAQKDLNKIPDEYRLRITAALQQLAKNPDSGKKLEGKESNHRSFQVWPYRIMYELSKSTLTVIGIRTGNRKDVYR